MYSIFIHSDAEMEYEDAYDHYTKESDARAENFFSAIDQKLQSILANPEAHSLKNNTCREAVVGGFPFVIVYRFKKRSHIINIVSIHHTSRKPKRRYPK